MAGGGLEILKGGKGVENVHYSGSGGEDVLSLAKGGYWTQELDGRLKRGRRQFLKKKRLVPKKRRIKTRFKVQGMNKRCVKKTTLRGVLDNLNMIRLETSRYEVGGEGQNVERNRTT